MKKITSLLLVLFSLVLFAQQDPIHLKDENLKGAIQSYEKKTYIVTPSTGELVQKYDEKKSFDTSGNLIGIATFGNDTKLDSKTVYKYEAGHLVSKIVYNSAGKEDKITQYEYDAENRLTSQKKYNSAGQLQYQTRYFYNSKGQMLSEHKLIPSINYTLKEAYQYDANNYVIEIAKKARIGTTKVTFSYNDMGKVAKKSDYNAMGELYSVIQYEYNQYGDKTGLKKYDADGKLTYFETYQYLYDKQGNWTERTNFEKGKKVSVEKRKVTYY